MPGIVEYPQVVRKALETYGDLFANEPERRHFANTENVNHKIRLVFIFLNAGV